MAKKAETVQLQVSIEDKLKALFQLQETDSKIDKIRTLRGELPLEVKDLEDELAGLDTRIQKFQEEISLKKEDILAKKNEIKDAQALIKKYEEQQMNVRNNREFESISKEIEFQNLEIELCEKRIREFNYEIENKSKVLDESKTKFDERQIDLNQKRAELDDIIAETQKDEEDLIAKSEELAKVVDDRLVTAYKRIRSNARNGLAVVSVERDACGGCFNHIPPQRQLDIKNHRKIIVCEYCGRILIDSALLFGEVQQVEETV